VFAAKMTAAHATRTFIIVIAVHCLIGGLTVSYLNLLLR